MSLSNEISKILQLEVSLSEDDSWIFDEPFELTPNPHRSHQASQHSEENSSPISSNHPTGLQVPDQSKSPISNQLKKNPAAAELEKLRSQSQEKQPGKTLKDLHVGLKMRPQGSFDNTAVLQADDLEKFNHALYNHPWYQSQQTLEDHHLNLIVGQGPLKPKLMVVNFQPYPEDVQIRQPFAGGAGELLRNMLKAIGIEKNLSYLSYLDHSSNPKRRLPREVKMLKDHLKREIEIVQPHAILLLGSELAEIILNESQLKDIVESQKEFAGIPTFATYPLHFMLHDPGWKRPAWQTLQTLKPLL